MAPLRSTISAARASAFSALLLLALAPPAWAQAEAARAETLFREGRALLDAKTYELACPKLAESERLDPSSGVELALGLCYERSGKTASAWGAFARAVTLAQRDGRADRAQAAAAEAATLEPRLSRVTFAVAPETARLAGLELRQDGIVIGPPSWVDGPVDPGDHTLDVKAPGHAPYSTTFVLRAEQRKLTVAVPALAPDALSPPGTPGASGHAGMSTVRVAGFAIAGTGAAALIIAAALGGDAIAKANAVHVDCPMTTCGDKAAIAESNTAGTIADTSTGLFIGGGAVLAAGALMALFAPTAKPTPSAIGLTVAPGYLGISGSF
jgi:hypothetical protein